MGAAPPFASFSSFTEGVASPAQWPVLYASLQAHKAHVQEYPGCQRFDVFVRIEDSGGARFHCYTTWDTPEQLEAFLERGYTVERLLADVGGIHAERSIVLEKLF